jgi:phage recombination protein Bet
MTRKTSTEVAVTGGKASLLAKFGDKYSMDPKVFLDTVQKTVFKDAKNIEQVITLLMVADQYGLSPVTKEIYAFPDKGGGVIPVVGVDGWNRIAQQHPQFDGVEFRYSDDEVVPDGGKKCPTWVECVVYRKDREHPVVIREYLDECYRKTGPWQSHTKRMLRHKALIQGYRTAFGFHGIYDEDEAQRMYVESTATEAPSGPSSSASKARQALGATPTTTEAVDEPETAPVDDYEDVPVDPETGEIVEGEVEEDEQAPPAPLATKQQQSAIHAAKRNNGWSDAAYSLLLAEYDAGHARELSREEAVEVVRQLMAGPGEEEA